MPQIDRKASIIFGDANIIIREDHPGRMPRYEDEKAWETQFKRQVFHRIVQTLNRLGWTCVVPEKDWHDEDQYGIKERFRRNKRECSKGDLKGFFELSGATIKFEMFQNVNAPNRPDHGGRYEFNKEAIMPYLLRLEMERTRRRIRTYLCNVFSGYLFDTEWMAKHGEKKVGPGSMTALERIQKHYDDSCHFKGQNWDEYKTRGGMGYNLGSADGQRLEHGQTVWLTDSKGRWQRGTAFYNINSMWWVLLGRYSYTNESCHELYTRPPEDLRAKRNERLRRKRLEHELNRATSNMDFERAILLRNQLFPERQPLYVVWHREHQLYHCTGFSGYTKDQSRAGKFTLAEAKDWVGSSDTINQIVRLGHLPN